MSRGTARRRSLAAGGAAVLLHGAFAAWLVLSARTPPPPSTRPDVEVSLATPPTAPPLRGREPLAEPARKAASSPAVRPRIAQTPAPPRTARGAASVTSSAGLAPSSPATAPSPSPRTDGFDAEGAARRAIAALFACHSEDGGPPDEASRKRCDSARLAQAHALPHIDGVPVEKRAVYDLQAAADEKRRSRMEGSMYEPVVRCTGAGSNFGTGCLPPDAMMHIRPR